MMTRVHDERQPQVMTGEPRESIWSVSRGVKHVYFALFIGLFTAGTIGMVQPGVASLAALCHDLAALAVTAAALSMVITETGRYLMVLAAAFEEWREKRRREQIARAVAEATAVGERRLAAWEAWNDRRMQAEQRGEPFDEPPPSAHRRTAEAVQQQ
ncbi:MAG: hypothetical protein OXU67_13785 [Chloroflexota bacterium]|nr:hypothetical protein [Chloroflexota bacterium]